MRSTNTVGYMPDAVLSPSETVVDKTDKMLALEGTINKITKMVTILKHSKRVKGCCDTE